jgi:hypothetical protein
LTPSPLAIWWRGSSSSPDYGIVEVTCIKLSCTLMIRVNELSIMIVTIFILPHGGSFLWDHVWDANMFSPLMYE